MGTAVAVDDGGKPGVGVLASVIVRGSAVGSATTGGRPHAAKASRLSRSHLDARFMPFKLASNAECQLNVRFDSC